jgi:uncharacterized protein (TIGR02145 family)
MRKLILTTAAVTAAIGLAGCSKTPTPKSLSTTLDTLAVTIDTQAVTHDTLPIMYDTLTDIRDGQKYKTVTIGTQTWMAQNINYQTESGSWCYNDSASYCKQYGRLYDRNTAKTACPNGWKLSDTADWNRLVAAAGGEEIAGKKLKSKSRWNENGNGTDHFGFSALSGGTRYYNKGNFYHVSKYGNWWTATEYGDNHAYSRHIYYGNNSVTEGINYKNYGFSVRCVADSP